MFSKKFKKELKVFITLVIVAFTVKTSVAEIYIVPSGSMEDTILVGDMLFGNKFIYGMKTPTWIGIPFRKAPPPLCAVNNSFVNGLNTTPTVTSP